MSISILRGAKLGGSSALIFAVVTPINNLIRHEQINLEAVLTGSVFALFLMGLIGTLTDKIGFDSGDA